MLIFLEGLFSKLTVFVIAVRFIKRKIGNQINFQKDPLINCAIVPGILFDKFIFVHFNHGVYAYLPFLATHVCLKHHSKSFLLFVIRIRDVDSLYKGCSQYSVTLEPTTVALPVNFDNEIEENAIKIKHQDYI